MTTRKPLVMNGGQIRQLAAGDALDAPLAGGSAWPTSPAAGMWYPRNDLGVIAQYDGARWIGGVETIPLLLWSGSQPANVTATTHLISIAGSIYITNFELVFNVTSTNNASNYWTMQLQVDGTLVGTAFSTATYSPSVVTRITQGAIAALQTPAIYVGMRTIKVGTPGDIFLSPLIRVRRVYA